MPTDRADCANYEINLKMCPCTNESCPNRGICCECVQAHSAAGKPNACNREPNRRDPATISLSELAVKCRTNYDRNLAFCPCDYQPCNNKGTCCSCVRNHFNVEGTGRVACMKRLG